MSELRITIVSSSGRARKHIHYLKNKLRAAHRLSKSSLREISIALVGEKRMSGLHEQFMGIAGPTDVLTFPLQTNLRGKCIEGEVVICAPVAERSAGKLGVQWKDELLLYALHGLLHLSGFDDKNQLQYRTMHRTEDAILKQLGVGEIFRRGRP
jgi:probable rRNA maturation factor